MNKPLPSGWYHVTLNQATIENNILILVFTVDRGEHSYKNLKKKFPLNDWGMDKLQSLFDEIQYVVDTNYETDFFVKQFTIPDIRAEAKVERRIKDKFIVNEIIEFRPPTKVPEWNVKKEKTDEFFQKENKGRGLPINE